MAIVTASGSNRVYSREEEDGRSVIRVKGTSRAENHAFIVMARHFYSLGLPVPEVYSVSDDEMEYTQEDLGDTLLFDYLRPCRESGDFSGAGKELLIQTMQQLCHIQVEGAKGMDWSVCYPVPSLDRRSIMWDLNYFKYDYLKLTGAELCEPALEDDFERLAEKLLAVPCDVFMYRDAQSRNVMVKDGKPYFIDFQGGRRGPIYYDLASFLWQAKACYPQALREELLDVYLAELAKTDYNRGRDTRVPSAETFRANLNHFVLFRMLQVLGAYGFRGLYERKAHFIESIPFARKNLAELFAQVPELQEEYPALYAATQIPDNRGRDTRVPTVSDQDVKGLTVSVYSFSFKKGVPEDVSGNGGGYVFDCRSTHNPGKYEQYKTKTGLDKPVIEFLEQDGEILDFLAHVYPIVDHHVTRFLERGFTHLQVSFGCTGGQHRSVYSAESLARHLRETFGDRIRVDLCHREQAHWYK